MNEDTFVLYRAFLLRWWQERTGAADDEPVWRVSLEEIGGLQRPRRGFASLPELMAYLRAELIAQGGAPASYADE